MPRKQPRRRRRPPPPSQHPEYRPDDAIRFGTDPAKLYAFAEFRRYLRETVRLLIDRPSAPIGRRAVAAVCRRQMFGTPPPADLDENDRADFDLVMQIGGGRTGLLDRAFLELLPDHVQETLVSAFDYVFEGVLDEEYAHAGLEWRPTAEERARLAAIVADPTRPPLIQIGESPISLVIHGDPRMVNFDVAGRYLRARYESRAWWIFATTAAHVVAEVFSRLERAARAPAEALVSPFAVAEDPKVRHLSMFLIQKDAIDRSRIERIIGGGRKLPEDGRDIIIVDEEAVADLDSPVTRAMIHIFDGLLKVGA